LGFALRRNPAAQAPATQTDEVPAGRAALEMAG
jgi:hypothetical protein